MSPFLCFSFIQLPSFNFSILPLLSAFVNANLFFCRFVSVGTSDWFQSCFGCSTFKYTQNYRCTPTLSSTHFLNYHTHVCQSVRQVTAELKLSSRRIPRNKTRRKETILNFSSTRAHCVRVTRIAQKGIKASEARESQKRTGYSTRDFL